MNADLGNALADVADPGVSQDVLRELDTQVAAAHDRIQAGCRADEFGYAALNLPETVSVEEIRDTVDSLPQADHVLLVGIGGSALGAATLVDACGDDTTLHVLDNLDPDQLADTLDQLPFEETVAHVVSRSGTTTETIANTVAVIDAFQTAGVDWRDRLFITTGGSGPLRDLADRHGLPVFDVPAGVPGRFSVLSTMGLPVAALAGVDIQAVVDGGQGAVDSLAPSLFDTPAYAFGATSYALAKEGALVNAMMPYGERLETFAEWFAQLWAESLGKDETGQIPARALGVTDQHSQLQLYRAGPRAIQVSFLTVTDRSERRIPTPAVDLGSDLAGRTVGEIMEAEFLGTEASLAAAGRPNLRLEIDRVDAESMGELLVSMEAACILAGELFDIDTFDQPAVEWSKRATRAILAGDATPEADAIEDKHELRVPETAASDEE